MNRPMGRLESAMQKLARQLKDSEHPLRLLRAAIDYQRKQGFLDERRVANEIEKILTRTEFAVEDIDNLAQRLAAETS